LIVGSAAGRLADFEHLAVHDRQSHAIGVFVDQDEITVEQCRHHRVGRDAVRLVEKGPQHQQHRHHREEAACVVDRSRDLQRVGLATCGAGGCEPARRQQPVVDAPDDARNAGDDDQYQTEIGALGRHELEEHRDHQQRQHAVEQPHHERVRRGLAVLQDELAPGTDEPVVDHADEGDRRRKHRHGRDDEIDHDVTSCRP
jgi:hypothetical protein